MMNLVTILLSCVSTFLVTYFGKLVESVWQIWIILLLLIGFYILFVALTFAFAGVMALFVNTKKEVKKPSKFYMALYNYVNAYLVWFAGVKIYKTGTEKLEKGKNYLFVFNHRSNFDPMIISKYFVKYKPLMISKPQNIKIPIAGPCIHKAGFMAIDRDNDREALKTIIKASNYVKNGYSVGVCPEGTRNKESVDLLPFKNGAFKIAQRGNAPIVVIALNGTENIHKNFPFRRTKVYLDVLSVIDSSEHLSKSTLEIGEEVAVAMQNDIDKYKN